MIKQKLYIDSLLKKSLFFDPQLRTYHWEERSSLRKKEILSLGGRFYFLYFNKNNRKYIRELYSAFLMYKLLLRKKIVLYDEQKYRKFLANIRVRELIKYVYFNIRIAEYIGSIKFTKLFKEYLVLLETGNFNKLDLKALRRVLLSFRNLAYSKSFYKTMNRNNFYISKEDILNLGLSGPIMRASALFLGDLNAVSKNLKEQGTAYDRAILIITDSIKLLENLSNENFVSFNNTELNMERRNLLKEAKLLGMGDFAELASFSSGLASLLVNVSASRVKTQLSLGSDKNVHSLILFQKTKLDDLLSTIAVYEGELADFEQIKQSFALHGFCIEL